jgi:hypothetical protein
MRTNERVLVHAVLIMSWCGALAQAAAIEPNWPAGFPEIVVTQNGAPAPGVFIGSVTQGFNVFYVILDNSGYPLYVSKTQPLSSFVQPNGLVAIAVLGVVNLKDETLTRLDSFTMTPGCTVDSHDVKLLTNGHALLIGKETRSIDMGQVIAGGRPDALVTGDVVQEIDADKHVVFEWHSLDQIPIADSFYDLAQKSIDYAHINSVALDPLDNGLLVSLRTTSEIVKVDRSTGETVWRFGGKGNQFTFIGEHEENAPYYTVGQHDVCRLANGNLLFFDNGNISGGGPNPCDRTYSRAVEYRLDEAAMTATLVWEFRHSPDISALCTGSVKRFDNGNTLIDWGCAVAKAGTMVTEVSASGDVVLEMAFAQPGPGSSLTKQLWNRPDIVQWQTYPNVKVGQSYTATQTGVSVTVRAITGNPDNNGLAVRKFIEATRFPRFSGKEPQLLVDRVVLSGYGMTDARIDVTFETKGPECPDPCQLTVYHRPFAGQGEFTALATTVNPDKTLKVTNASLGEFVFGYPDAPDVPLQPVLRSPADLIGVNQAESVVLQWTAKGLARSYDLQVATDPQFTVLAVDQSALTQSRYTLSTLTPGQTYCWRVRTRNYGGTGPWAVRSFTAAPPAIRVTSPNGGEQWGRGLKSFIRWEDNLSEAVVVDLYKAGVFVQTIAKVTSDPAVLWEPALALKPGDDYAIRIKSSTREAVVDVSDGPFTLR